jgi:hypothetical protein
MTYRETRYGFEWDAAEVSRLMGDEQHGVVIQIRTKANQLINVRVTPRGLIRVSKVGKRVWSKKMDCWVEKGAEIE